MSPRPAFELGGVVVKPGQRKAVELPIAKLVTGTQVALPVLVVHGKLEGPTVWVNACIHGDEINGVEIIRRVLERLDAKTLRGTVLAVPIVNVHGFVNGDRYLPDRRDLNRSFPGSARGSLASRIANLLMTQVVARCTFGIDLHTGSDHRINLPQVRADLNDPLTLDLATAFGTPVMLHSAIRDGSLRQAATDAGATVLLFEGGEAWRFGEDAIQHGVNGVLRVFERVGMVDPLVSPAFTPLVSRSSKWVRSSHSGIAQIAVPLGEEVMAGEVMGRIHDSFGRRLGQIKSPIDGTVIGLNLQPLMNRGDAIVHIAATVAHTEPAPTGVARSQSVLNGPEGQS